MPAEVRHLQSAVHQARSDRRRGLRRRPQSAVAGSAERRPRRAGAGGGEQFRRAGAVRAAGLFRAATRIRRRTARCSTAPSDCVIPAPRRSAEELTSEARSRQDRASEVSARGDAAHGGLGQGQRRQPWPGRDVGRRGAAPARARLGGRLARTFGRAAAEQLPQLGDRRHRPGPAAAVAAGRLRPRHRALFHRRPRAGLVGGLGPRR